jgi:starvation-inducible DNA-binding protein
MERSKAKAILQLERYALFASPSDLPEPTKRSLIDGLNARLADGIDLYAIVKGAHWNLKGPQFAALHPFFENER